MKIGRFTLSAASVALLVIQLAIVSSIAAKYLYQRWRCPRVWTRAVSFEPELPMRGRYLSLQLEVDGCQSTLPSAKAATFPRDYNGAAVRGPYGVRASAWFRGNLKVEDNRLIAIRVDSDPTGNVGQEISALPGTPCDRMRLDRPVDFYIPESAADPSRLKPGQELWIEVTVPPKGPRRPIHLALKDNGAWKPLSFE